MANLVFRYQPPAREEWRALAIQTIGSLAALILTWRFLPSVRSNSTVLVGVTIGVFYLLLQSTWALRKKWQRARFASIQISAQELRIKTDREVVVLWSDILRCEAVENRVRVVWKEGAWEFAPREIVDGQTLAREIKTRATPNFIALEAK